MQTEILGRPAKLSPVSGVLSPQSGQSDPGLRAQDSGLTTILARCVPALAASAVLCMFLTNVFFRQAYSGDEGFYGVTSINMLQSASYIVRPSYTPDGDFLAEKGAFAHPPWNSYFYALGLWLFHGSLVGPEVVSALSFAALLWVAFQLMRQFDNQAARFTILLLAASPAMVGSYSQLEAEPLMVTFGLFALYFACKIGPARAGIRWPFLSGICLGFSFGLKLWLCGPLALALLVALANRAREHHWALREKLVALVIFGVGALIPSGLHLLVVAWTHPEDLAFWIKDIYFGLFTGVGISGSKVAGAGVDPDWVHPFWYYGPVLYREHFFLAPIILLGLGPALRDLSLKREVLWIIAAGVFGLIPLSVVKVKEPLYVLSCVVFIYFLAGICLAGLARKIKSRVRNPQSTVRTVRLRTQDAGPITVLAGLMVLFPLAYALGIQPQKITGGFVLAHTVTFGLCLMLFLWSRRKALGSVFEWSVYAVCAIVVLMTLAYDRFSRPPRDKVIAQLIQPYVESNTPNTLSIIASEFKRYQLHSYRRGCYWRELPLAESPELVLREPRYGEVRAFILDSKDAQKPELAAWISWLETHATEKTGELNAKLGRSSGFRLFVRESSADDGSPQTQDAKRPIGAAG